jgi:hypothetical protein
MTFLLPDMPKVSDMLPPSPDTARQVAGDALAMLPEDEQEFLAQEAKLLIDSFYEGAEMPTLFESRHLDMEETLAIWFLLPSNVRSAIKKRTPK